MLLMISVVLFWIVLTDVVSTYVKKYSVKKYYEIDNDALSDYISDLFIPEIT